MLPRNLAYAIVLKTALRSENGDIPMAEFSSVSLNEKTRTFLQYKVDTRIQRINKKINYIKCNICANFRVIDESFA